MGRKFKEIFSKGKQKTVFCLIFAVFCAFSGSSQSPRQDYLEYIKRFTPVAIQFEHEFGVPASITLAQGILESSAGRSRMAQEANNHFGIKAYHWQGEVYGRCDSLKQVGYRKYGTPEDSFLDHAQFLKGPRYSILYQFDITDYRSWAQGLRDCGYAEDANYPAKLINIIEQYELYALDGGHRLDGDRVIQQDEAEEQPNNDRWHHRKRRNRSAEQNQVQQEQSQENQPTFTPMRQGRVGSSADND